MRAKGMARRARLHGVGLRKGGASLKVRAGEGMVASHCAVE